MPFLGGLISGAGSLLSGGLQAFGASSAADTTAKAATNAANIQLDEFNQTTNTVKPWVNLGGVANDTLSNLLGINKDTGAFDPNALLQQDTLKQLGPLPLYNMLPYTAQMYQQSPGYNAALQGGVGALQNAGATTTGGLSGNTLKALMGYGTGLANADYQQNYQNYANNYMNQFKSNSGQYWNAYNAENQYKGNLYNWLGNLGTQGLDAALKVGQQGVTATNNAGNALIGAGAATAAGTLGTTNALGGTVNSLSTLLNSPTSANNNSLLSSLLYGQGGYGGSGGDLSSY